MKRAVIWSAAAVCLVLVGACDGGGAKKASSNSSVSTSSSSAAPTLSSSSSSSPLVTAADACAGLTDDEVAAVIGTAITRREPAQKTASSSGCVKGNDRTSADLQNAAFVSFNTFTSGGAALLDQLGSEGGAEEVTGLGERALFSVNEGFVFVLKGSNLYQVQVFKFGQPGTRDEVVALAQAFVGRA